ncbi:MAG: hypothetical protein ACK40G_13800 [Cytophagaceae bacterium]
MSLSIQELAMYYLQPCQCINRHGYKYETTIDGSLFVVMKDFDVDVKPILRRLSDITDEEAIEVAKMVCYRLQRGLEPLHYKFLRGNTNKVEVSYNNSIGYASSIIEITKDGVCFSSEKCGAIKDYYTPNQYKVTQYLIANGLDVFNWIETEKAIDKTKLASK